MIKNVKEMSKQNIQKKNIKIVFEDLNEIDNEVLQDINDTVSEPLVLIDFKKYRPTNDYILPITPELAIILLDREKVGPLLSSKTIAYSGTPFEPFIHDICFNLLLYSHRDIYSRKCEKEFVKQCITWNYRSIHPSR
ncbi:MAG: hypothetical protein ACFFCS_13215 [Candidatus Hodarchaeota archaeon]